MAEPRLFVSHATADLDAAQRLVGSLEHLPVRVSLAGEQVRPGRARRNLEGQLRNSDLLISLLTAEGAADPWVNQELGYAVAAGVPIVPVIEDESAVRGYHEGTEGVQFEGADLDVTAFNLLSRLRSELEPVGSMVGPDWFLSFSCTADGCGRTVHLEIEDHQTDLWGRAEDGDVLVATCPECETGYEFDPATLTFVDRVDPEDH